MLTLEAWEALEPLEPQDAFEALVFKNVRIASLRVANKNKDDKNDYCQDNAYRPSSLISLIGLR